jgi:hypothetical protein
MLKALQELEGESGGFMEAKVIGLGGGVLVRFPLDLLEEAVHDTEMEMGMGIEAGAEAVGKAH